jgi:hypothetical protein
VVLAIIIILVLLAKYALSRTASALNDMTGGLAGWLVSPAASIIGLAKEHPEEAKSVLLATSPLAWVYDKLTNPGSSASTVAKGVGTRIKKPEKTATQLRAEADALNKAKDVARDKELQAQTKANAEKQRAVLTLGGGTTYSSPRNKMILQEARDAGKL